MTEIGYYPGKSARNNVLTYMQQHLERYPDRVALSWVPWDAARAFAGDLAVTMPHQHVTYGQFAQFIENAAAGLTRLGIGHGDRVIIFLPMGVGMYAAMFAVQRIGAIAVFLDSWARSAHLGASADCVHPKAMISHRAAFELVDQVPEFADMKLRIIGGATGDARFDARLEELIMTPGKAPIAEVTSEETALITFTTGSTGTPKGANRTHRFLSAQHLALSHVIPYEPADVDLPAFPIFSLNNLASGVTTVVPALDLAAPSALDAALLCSQIQHQRVTCTTLSPSMFNGVSSYCITQGVRLDGLRRVVTGGAPISRDDLANFRKIAPGAEILVLYGSTEVEPMAHIEAKEMIALTAPADPEMIEEGVNVGTMSEELRYKFLRIVDGPIDLAKTPWSALEVARGKVGELVVAGDHVCRDYYNNQDAFRRAKIVDEDGAVWHRTGDLARIDERGYLYVVGRVNNAVARGDDYLFPVRAEVILKRIPEAKQVAFLGLPDPTLGQKATVVLELRSPDADRAAATREAQRLFAKNDMPIDALYYVSAIPMDPRHHSKVEYEVLRKQLLEGGAVSEL
jgi:acyl-CoA synthetase (AMP-forming)/AMP-acid ligase II